MNIRMKEARFKAQKTQVQISRLTGIPQPQISLIERGFWNPTEEEKIKLANALGVEIVWLFPKEVNK